MIKKLSVVMIVLVLATQMCAEKVSFDEVYKNLKPTLYWEYFKEISAVPRPSGHMQPIINYMKEFAEKNDITDITVDKGGNVIMRVPATKGYENRQMLTLQAHMDIVPAKSEDSNHNFKTDPLKLFVEGDWVMGDGTNIGADDGMGVAEMLSILADKKLQHGPIEAVFTTDEEIGLVGVRKMEQNSLKGDYILNLDGGPCMGGGGAVTTDMIYDIEMQKTPKGQVGLQIVLHGLVGGHSAGVQAGAANAIKEVAYILDNLENEYDINLFSINGGNAMNAIPNKCVADITVLKNKRSEIIAKISAAEKELKGIFFNTDPNLKIEVKNIDLPQEVIRNDQQRKLIKALVACFTGVYRVNSAYKVLETSTNLGIVKTENNKVIVTTMQRSSVEYAKQEIASIVAAPFELIGAKITYSNDFPAWQAQPNSDIVKLVTKAYKDVQNKDIKFRVSHAGFECGVLASKGKKGLAAATIGALAPDAHKHTEKLSIKSAQEQHDIILYVIENMPLKK